MASQCLGRNGVGRGSKHRHRAEPRHDRPFRGHRSPHRHQAQQLLSHRPVRSPCRCRDGGHRAERRRTRRRRSAPPAGPLFSKYKARSRRGIATPAPSSAGTTRTHMCGCRPAPRLPSREGRQLSHRRSLIRSFDGTWHRPFTTLKFAMLQSLVDPEQCLIDAALRSGRASVSRQLETHWHSSSMAIAIKRSANALATPCRRRPRRRSPKLWGRRYCSPSSAKRSSSRRRRCGCARLPWRSRFRRPSKTKPQRKSRSVA
ncbi:hypothetical protein BRCH_04464c [Candidatus Burkholderia brachyanthoides]|nr:hypothetical protein BRCH_04464c [Candidatus Burkholderia brachyanthoides]